MASCIIGTYQTEHRTWMISCTMVLRRSISSHFSTLFMLVFKRMLYNFPPVLWKKKRVRLLIYFSFSPSFPLAFTSSKAKIEQQYKIWSGGFSFLLLQEHWPFSRPLPSILDFNLYFLVGESHTCAQVYQLTHCYNPHKLHNYLSNCEWMEKEKINIVLVFECQSSEDWNN